MSVLVYIKVMMHTGLLHWGKNKETESRQIAKGSERRILKDNDKLELES